MKKLICMILALVLVAAMTTMAGAENNKLGDFANRLKKAAQQQSEQPAEEQVAVEGAIEDIGPSVNINDAFYQKVTSSTFLYEDKYSKKVNFIIELKNVSGNKLYPQGASVKVYNVNGEVLEEKSYSMHGPLMVENGDSLFVWTNFYPQYDLASISHIDVTVDSKTNSYYEYAKIESSAMTMDGLGYALIENTMDTDIYGVRATIVVRNDAGQLLDAVEVYNGNYTGIFPGSTMILRDNIRDYVNNGYLTTGNATAYALYQLN